MVTSRGLTCAIVTALCGAACAPRPSTGADAGPGGGSCTFPFAGDRSLPPELVLTAMGDGNEVTELTNGSPVPLMFPPQGGRVAYIGVRARNVDPCGMQLTCAFQDPVNEQVRLDSRTVSLRPVDGGMAVSPAGVANLWANVPLCPNAWAQQDVFGQPFRLNLTLEQRDGRTASRSIEVVPFCPDGGDLEQCRCICQKGYLLGQTCGMGSGMDGGMMDGGMMDGGPGDAG